MSNLPETYLDEGKIILNNKCTYLEMLHKTLDEIKERKGDASAIIDEIEQTEKMIEKLKSAIDAKNYDDYLKAVVMDYSDFDFNDDEHGICVMDEYQVKTDDFDVIFDDVDIDSRFVASITWDDNEKTIYLSMFDYIIEENGNTFKLMKQLSELFKQPIGSILFQYPKYQEGEKSYAFKFNNCTLDQYFINGFDKREKTCHIVNLVILFESKEFIE